VHVTYPVAEREERAQWESNAERTLRIPDLERLRGGRMGHGWRASAAGCGVMLVAGALALSFHLNQPTTFLPYHDSMEQVRRADTILAGGAWADPARMPGYPLSLAGVFAVTGAGNLAAADAAQLILFVLAAGAVYLLALRLWRRVSTAVVVGVLFASNIFILSYFTPILSDGLALLLTVLLALALLALLARPAAWRLWLVSAALLALVLTRAEWALVAVPLYAYLLLAVGWRRVGRRLAGHGVAEVGVLYGALAALVVTNREVNGFTGLTDAENIYLYGKVAQYHMQYLAPARYSALINLRRGDPLP
jgi:hypothetical protein